MKSKQLLLIGTIGLMMVSCAEEEPARVKSAEGAIGFRPAMSRATETTNANLTDIYVTALEAGAENDYFSNLKFTKGTEGFFVSSPSYYWPGDDSELTFYAYSPSADELGADVTIDASTKTIANYSVPEQIADQMDLITATATGKKSTNEDTGAEMTFSHQLSQIEIQAKSANDAYVVKAIGARIGRAQYLATFDFTTSKWTLDDWHDTAIYDTQCDTVTLSETAVSLMGEAGNAMLLPQQLYPWSPTDDPDNVAREAYLSVLVNITTADGAQVYPFANDKKTDSNGNKRTFAWATVPLTANWEAGKKYIYVLDFTNGAGFVDPDDPTPGVPVLGEPIKIKPQVTDWTESDIPTPMPLK